MSLKSYTKKIFRPDCNPSFQSLQCIAHLDQDVSEALPYLNASLDRFEYLKDPPALTFRVHGKIITIHPTEVAVNALKDGEEVDKILKWLKREINEAWEKKDEIEPSYESAPKPNIFQILKYLPKTNCGECSAPTCTVFATMVAQSVKGPEACPQLFEEDSRKLKGYVNPFHLND